MSVSADEITDELHRQIEAFRGSWSEWEREQPAYEIAALEAAKTWRPQETQLPEIDPRDIAQRLADIHAKILEIQKAAKPTPWRTVDEAAEHCRVSREIIKNRTIDGTIKAHRGLSGPKYHVDELDAAIREEGIMKKQPADK